MWVAEVKPGALPISGGVEAISAGGRAPQDIRKIIAKSAAARTPPDRSYGYVSIPEGMEDWRRTDRAFPAPLPRNSPRPYSSHTELSYAVFSSNTTSP